MEKDFNLNKKYLEFCDLFMEYIRKEDMKKMFYARIYLIYLAKKNKLKLTIPAISEYRERLKDEILGYNRLLKDLIKKFKEKIDSKEYWNLLEIKELFEKYISDKELDSKMFKELAELTIKELEDILIINSLELKKYSSREDDETPELISELAAKLLKINSEDDVLDLCSGNGDFLASLTKDTGIKIYGIEIDPDSCFISRIRLEALTDGTAEIIMGDALTHVFNKKFDKIFCEYPFRLRVDKHTINILNQNAVFKWNRPGLTADWLFLNKVMTTLKPNGIAALLVTDGPLFKSLDIDCRRDILIKKIIKYIIKLPNGILPNANLSPNLIILSNANDNNEIKFIDATQLYTENKQKEKKLNVGAIVNLIANQKNDNKVATKKVEEILNSKDVLLTVNSYVKKKEPNYIKPLELKELLIDKYRGYQFSTKEINEIEETKGDYELLTIGDINDGIINNNLVRINGNNNKYDRYLLKDGDVVISSKGTKIKIAVADVAKRKIIPNGNLLVLRLDSTKINPYYLQAYLNSESGYLSLKNIQTGAVIISINPSRIEQINVSMVSMQEQEVFAEKYKRKMDELLSAQKRVKKLQKQLENLYTKEIEDNYKYE